MHRRSGAKILGGKSFVGTVDGGGGWNHKIVIHIRFHFNL